MGRMDQVGVAVGIRMERQEETVRQSLLQSFGAAIRSPFVPFDQVYLGRKRAESIFDFLDLLGGNLGLKPNMTTWRSTLSCLEALLQQSIRAENARIASEAKIVFFMMIRINL